MVANILSGIGGNMDLTQDSSLVLVPQATHSGIWDINRERKLLLRCYVMNNGERVLSLRGTSKAMGLTGSGSTALVKNLSTRWIAPYLTEDLKEWLNMAARNEAPIYLTNHGGKFTPFRAELFIDLCKAYIEAQRDNALPSEHQQMVASRLLMIMTAFAKVGLIALIDEVTGYQDDRDRTELQRILAKYISADLLSWAKRFPDEFYKQMFRLKKWDYHGTKKSPLAGKITNEYVYQYLPDGVLNELRRKNPVSTQTRRRKNRHHQFLTEETGIKHLDHQLQQTLALMKASDDWNEFDKLFRKSMGQPLQIEIDEILPSQDTNQNKDHKPYDNEGFQDTPLV